jgi:hypothetical protein
VLHFIVPDELNELGNGVNVNNGDSSSFGLSGQMSYNTSEDTIADTTSNEQGEQLSPTSPGRPADGERKRGFTFTSYKMDNNPLNVAHLAQTLGLNNDNSEISIPTPSPNSRRRLQGKKLEENFEDTKPNFDRSCSLK